MCLVTRQFELVIGFIEHFEFETKSNYDAFANSRTRLLNLS
jgi:hypothetical protein